MIYRDVLIVVITSGVREQECIHKFWYIMNECKQYSNKRQNEYSKRLLRKHSPTWQLKHASNIGVIKNKHSTPLDKMHAHHDLHLWKWLRLKIQSLNCAPTRWLKHRNGCIQTNTWKLVTLTWNTVVCQDKFDSHGYQNRLCWVPDPLTTTLLCLD